MNRRFQWTAYVPSEPAIADASSGRAACTMLGILAAHGVACTGSSRTTCGARVLCDASASAITRSTRPTGSGARSANCTITVPGQPVCATVKSGGDAAAGAASWSAASSAASAPPALLAAAVVVVGASAASTNDSKSAYVSLIAFRSRCVSHVSSAPRRPDLSSPHFVPFTSTFGV